MTKARCSRRREKSFESRTWRTSHRILYTIDTRVDELSRWLGTILLSERVYEEEFEGTTLRWNLDEEFCAAANDC